MTSCMRRVIVLLLFACPLSAMRFRRQSKSNSNVSAEVGRAPVIYYDGSSLSGTMKITRPSTGGDVYSGSSKKFSLGSFNREYLVKYGSCVQPIYTKKNSGRLCSVGKFSSSWKCTAISKSKVEGDYNKYAKLMWTSSRGVGLEFEFVARQAANNRDGVRSCFFKVDKNLPKRNRPKWGFVHDGSVKPLTASEASKLGLSRSETEGVGFELVSPPPPNVLRGEVGFRTTIDMLAVVRHMGVQAGPSCGLHVHVNTKGDGGGSKFTRRQIAYVWAAYARYQFAINEMLTPARIGNKYASSLFFGNCDPISSGSVVNNRCGYYRRLWGQLHKFVRSNNDQVSDKVFCNTVLKMPEDQNPCDKRWPKVRYSQVNLVPVGKYGTMEFRGHSATYDTERILRWVQFCIGFVERFGKAGGKATGMGAVFSGTPSGDYKKLQKLQQTSTMKELYTQLSRGRPGQALKWRQTDFLSYYQERKWEKNDKHCRPSGSALTVKPKCNDYSPSNLPSSLAESAAPDQEYDPNEQWIEASVLAENGTSRVVRAPVPASIQAGSYLDVLMPEGKPRAQLVDEVAVRNGFLEFSYEPEAEEDVKEEEAARDASLMQEMDQDAESDDEDMNEKEQDEDEEEEEEDEEDEEEDVDDQEADAAEDYEDGSQE